MSASSFPELPTGLATQDHFREWWGYGVSFLATAICLIGFGLALPTP